MSSSQFPTIHSQPLIEIPPSSACLSSRDFYGRRNQAGVQTAHGEIKKFPLHPAFPSLSRPLQRAFTRCLFSDPALEAMWWEKIPDRRSGMDLLKGVYGGRPWLFPSGIIGCSTPCTWDLWDMKREMGPAGILSIIGTGFGSWELSGMGNSLSIFLAEVLVLWKIRWDW